MDLTSAIPIFHQPDTTHVATENRQGDAVTSWHSTLTGLDQYAAWAAAQRLTEADHLLIRRHIARMSNPPLISVLLPVYNPPAIWLRACIDSVLAQLYPNWELCIADDASAQPAVRAILAEYTARDARIKVVYRPENGHISAATNSALALATGAFAAFLDHDDMLADHALYMVAAVIDEHRHADVIYSDEDIVDPLGKLLRPRFKPGWSPDYFRICNYIAHLTVIRMGILRAIGGLRLEIQGAQDHDVLLRSIEQTTGKEIYHIPHILYHWRAHFLSVTVHVRAKPYTIEASRQLIEDMVQRQALDIEKLVPNVLPYLHRIRYRLPEPAPLVSVIVATCARPAFLRACVAGLRASTDYPNLELIIVAGGSRHSEMADYLHELARQPGTQVLRQEGECNTARLNNAGAAVACGEVLCFLHDDVTFANANWLRELVCHALRPEIGAAGPLLRYPDGRSQNGGIHLHAFPDVAFALHQPLGAAPPSRYDTFLTRNVAALSGACLAVRRHIFGQAGGFDARLAAAHSDVDLCLNLRAAGYWLVFAPFADVIHHDADTVGGQNAQQQREQRLRDGKLVLEKWGAWATTDPFSNPNLTTRDGVPTLAMPSPAPRPWLAYQAGAAGNAVVA